MENSKKQDKILQEMLEAERRNIENYNNGLLKKSNSVIEVDTKYEEKKYLKSISWQLPEIDREAIEDFKRSHDCTYQDIIKYALRYYLTETNYNHAKEIIELREKHYIEHRGE